MMVNFISSPRVGSYISKGLHILPEDEKLAHVRNIFLGATMGYVGFQLMNSYSLKTRIIGLGLFFGGTVIGASSLINLDAIGRCYDNKFSLFSESVCRK